MKEKVFSSSPDDRIVDLTEERKRLKKEKKKRLTFSFEFDQRQPRFELAPLSEQKLIEKARKEMGK